MSHHPSNIPWIEKYRPEIFDDIVLDTTNRQFFQNILDTKYFPNLLFYGPPGTGKTTTILNLINEYKNPVNVRTLELRSNVRVRGITVEDVSSHVINIGGNTSTLPKHSSSGKHRENVIHLNASDERGIDIIRNQIHQFVRSNHLFEPGLKFVILDEVDYMTKNAQQALKTLLQTCRSNVRFCLICNYISKIDESLQNEFVCVRFNQLPKKEIHRFIRNIATMEQLEMSDDEIETIQINYNSDIRSMINFIQLHAITYEETSGAVHSANIIANSKMNIIRKEHWETIHHLLMPRNRLSKREIAKLPSETAELYIHKLSILYNTDKRNILNSYFNYVIRHFPDVISPDFLTIVENATHDTDTIPIKHVLQYICAKLGDYYAKCI
jgi:replication factor C subunit 3/5